MSYEQDLLAYNTEIRARESQAAYFRAEGVTDPVEIAARKWLEARYKPGPAPTRPTPPAPSFDTADVGSISNHVDKDAIPLYLWLVEEPEAGWDCTQAIVVIAATMDEALEYFGGGSGDDIFATRVGIALPGAKAGLRVCVDFLHG